MVKVRFSDNQTLLNFLQNNIKRFGATMLIVDFENNYIIADRFTYQTYNLLRDNYPCKVKNLEKVYTITVGNNTISALFYLSLIIGLLFYLAS
mgnify:CR=1 FL=1